MRSLYEQSRFDVGNIFPRKSQEMHFPCLLCCSPPMQGELPELPGVDPDAPQLCGEIFVQIDQPSEKPGYPLTL